MRRKRSGIIYTFIIVFFQIQSLGQFFVFAQEIEQTNATEHHTPNLEQITPPSDPIITIPDISEQQTSEAVNDELVNDELVNDELVNDELVNDELVNDELVNDELVNDELVNDEAVNDEAVDDELVNDEAVDDEAVDDGTGTDTQHSLPPPHDRNVRSSIEIDGIAQKNVDDDNTHDNNDIDNIQEDIIIEMPEEIVDNTIYTGNTITSHPIGENDIPQPQENTYIIDGTIYEQEVSNKIIEKGESLDIQNISGEYDTIEGETPLLIFPHKEFIIGSGGFLDTESVSSIITSPSIPAFRCSLIARHNLIRLTGKSYTSGISNNSDFIAAGDAISLIHQGKENNSLTQVSTGALEKYLSKHAKTYNGSIFDMYIYQPDEEGIFQGHRFVAFIDDTQDIYVLDPLRGEQTSSPQLLKNYLDSYRDEEMIFYVKDIPYKTHMENISTQTITYYEYNDDEEDAQITGNENEGIINPKQYTGKILSGAQEELISRTDGITGPFSLTIDHELILQKETPLRKLPIQNIQNSNIMKHKLPTQKYIHSLSGKTTKITRSRFAPGTKVISTKEKQVHPESLQLQTVEDTTKFPTNKEVLQAIELGPNDDHLIFSQPVQIDIAVDPALNGQEVDILVAHLGNEKFSRSGLTTDPHASCNTDGSTNNKVSTVTVNDGKATIYTCGASTFIVTYAGGQNFDNFVDNSSSNKTITITTGDVSSGSTITDINVMVNFRKIDGEDPSTPGAGQAYADEIYMSLQSPTGTSIDLILVDTYTNTANAPRVTVTFDDGAASAPSGLPTTGTFLSTDNLSSFNGEDPLGDWILTFGDDANQDGLILFEAQLEIVDNANCGDGILAGAEGCDDGNTTNGDGCSASCFIENNYACNFSGSGVQGNNSCVSSICDETEAIATCEASNSCGNSALESGETCDDGNTISGDGCDSTCTVERCGDGNIDTAATVGYSFFAEDFESIGNGTLTTNGTIYSSGSYTISYENNTANGRVRYGTNAVQNNGGGGAATLDVNTNNVLNINYLIFEMDMNAASGVNDLELAFDRSDHGDETHTHDKVRIRGSNTDAWIEVYDRKAHDIGNGTYQSVSAIDIDSTLASNSQTISSTFQIRFGQEDNFPANNVNSNDGFSVDNINVTGTKPGPATDELCDDGGTTGGDGCTSTCLIEPGYICTGEPSICVQCGDGVIGTGETCDDGNTDNGDGCSNVCQVETDRSCSGTPSTCIQCTTEDIIIGYAVSSVNATGQSVSYSTFTNHTYQSIPVVIATPQTQNNSDNYPIPVISNITTGGFDIEICVDSGATTCDNNPIAEDVVIFVVDVDKTSCTDHIEAGTTNIATNGSDTSFSFASGFTNTPYVFTTPQTSSQGGNIAAVAWVDDNSLNVNGGDFIGCVHQNGSTGDVNICSSSQPDESLGWIALDPSLFSMTGFDMGTQTINNSIWAAITFSTSYTQTPGIMVTQNSDNGGQDPQYAWANDVLTTGADIRYCEQDGPNDCDTHTNEIVRWFSVDIAMCGNGDINNGETCDDNNDTAGDGCSDTCQVESGYICVGEPSICAICGNSSVDGAETCDDGNTTSGDGCDSTCQLEVVPTGDICIATPSGSLFTGSWQTENYAQVIEQQFTGDFTVHDTLGADSGYYTTLQITNFIGGVYGDTISNAQLERKADTVDYISGDLNADVVLDSSFTSYSTANSTTTFIKRDSGVNSNRIGTYGAQPWLRFTIPAYTRPDIYQATLTYTLYEN